MGLYCGVVRRMCSQQWWACHVLFSTPISRSLGFDFSTFVFDSKVLFSL